LPKYFSQLPNVTILNEIWHPLRVSQSLRPSIEGRLYGDRQYLEDGEMEPERLIGLYKRAGAKYFFAMGAHHDNFDMYDSAHHDWNPAKVGPKKVLVGTWSKAVRANGLRFGISNHNSWAARWLQPTYRGGIQRRGLGTGQAAKRRWDQRKQLSDLRGSTPTI
jgi:hypothetical protein